MSILCAATLLVTASLLLPTAVGYLPLLAVSFLVAPLLTLPLAAHFVVRDRERGVAGVLASMRVDRTSAHASRLLAALVAGGAVLLIAVVLSLIVTVGAGDGWRGEIGLFLAWGAVLALEGSLIGLLLGAFVGGRVATAVASSFTYLVLVLAGAVYASSVIASYGPEGPPRALVALLHLSVLAAPFDALGLYGDLVVDAPIPPFILASVMLAASGVAALAVTRMQTRVTWRRPRNGIRAAAALAAAATMVAASAWLLAPTYAPEPAAHGSVIRDGAVEIRGDLDIAGGSPLRAGDRREAVLQLAIDGVGASPGITITSVDESVLRMDPRTVRARVFDAGDGKRFAEASFNVTATRAPVADVATRTLGISLVVGSDAYEMGLPVSIVGPGPRRGPAGLASLALLGALGAWMLSERRRNA